jgi:hypothetical protein
MMGKNLARRQAKEGEDDEGRRKKMLHGGAPLSWMRERLCRIAS